MSRGKGGGDVLGLMSRSMLSDERHTFDLRPPRSHHTKFPYSLYLAFHGHDYGSDAIELLEDVRVTNVSR
jgi:hypothetical protein